MELSKILSKMHLTAEKGNKVVAIHLFGIEYGNQLVGQKPLDIAVAAGIPESYATEIAKGIKLSKFVTPNGNMP